MIFTGCVKCNEPIIVYYETGDEGAGGAEKVTCEKCGAVNFVELISFGGITLSEKDFWKKHPSAKKRKRNNE